MTQALSPAHPVPLAPQWLDMALAVLLLAWTAEALARFPTGSALTALVYGAFCLRFCIDPGALAGLVRRCPALVPFPLVCLCSTLWSEAPGVTLTAALQLCFTCVAGAWIGHRLGLEGLARALLLALSATLVASTLNLGGWLGLSHAPGGGFLGIYAQKNALGQRALLVLLAGLLVVLTARDWRGRVVAMACVMLAVAMIAASRSATSLVMAAAMGGLMLWWLVAGRGGTLRAMALVTAGAAALGGLTLVWQLGADPVATLLQALGKNATMTGRTLLWEVALDRISDRPLLGHGYMAYWSAPRFAQETWILTRLYGETVAVFHNFALEILVGLGPAGLAAMGILLWRTLSGLWRLDPGPVRVWALVLLLTLLVLSALGSSLHRPHEITMVLIAALLAAARPVQRTSVAYS
ncbi:O-antigen ligase family protein [Halovulum dunhuangense]|uniref:O-antigen ligase family protein n=1 Tax=Halovulum dunhuangense TaxID=1505036 RepID=A0A849KYA9_9RHOB|nr:O-antigen ligase family protein [Halovulum dunhuangense]NNU79066.1 O-antigen ligase family protein [Halovulum dunhuangense]